ncbi:MAG: hypothetical protein U5K27_01940 [Desulfotignum sp.]|nr:hypothetical protein [Desulfotignum sp.]
MMTEIQNGWVEPGSDVRRMVWGLAKSCIWGLWEQLLITILIIAAVNIFQSRQSVFLPMARLDAAERFSNVLLKTIETRYDLQLDKIAAQDMGMLAS